MRARNALSILCIIMAMVLTVTVRNGAAQNAEKYVVSIPAKRIGILSDDRISKYRIVVQAGFIAGLLKISQGWNTTIIDDLSQNSVIDAIASHGVAYMTFDNVSNGAFDSFLIIQQNPYLAKAGLPLDIEVKLTIASMVKPLSRDVTIKMKDLLLIPYPH
jgi:hypothetical protein